MTPETPPWGIVCRPVEGDPGKLLATGPCPAKPFADPPALVSSRGSKSLGRPTADSWWPGYADGRVRPKAVYALPIWWKNQVCPEGWDRARRAVWAAERMSDPAHSLSWALASVVNPTVGMALKFAKLLHDLGLAMPATLLDQDPETGAIRERRST